MLSDNKRLSLLLRKSHGRNKLEDYKKFFVDLDLTDLEYIDLEQSDNVIERIKDVFPSIDRGCEMINGDASIEDSELLNEIYKFSNENAHCYIFTDQVEHCGMFKASASGSLKKCLMAIKLAIAFDNTFFLTDCEFKYSFTINYYDENDRYDKNKFDIQRQVVKEII